MNWFESSMIRVFVVGGLGLLMLVSALMGQDRIREVYRHAVDTGYRFFSYGDASLLIP